METITLDNIYKLMLNFGKLYDITVSYTHFLATKPAIILADEPTGNLDSQTSMDVILLMQSISRQFHQTTIMITHNEELAQMADLTIRIEDGKVVSGGVRYAR